MTGQFCYINTVISILMISRKKFAGWKLDPVTESMQSRALPSMGNEEKQSWNSWKTGTNNLLHRSSYLRYKSNECTDVGKRTYDVMCHCKCLRYKSRKSKSRSRSTVLHGSYNNTDEQIAPSSQISSRTNRASKRLIDIINAEAARNALLWTDHLATNCIPFNR